MRVDEDFLQEVGLGEMPEAEKQAFIDHAEEELEVRVGQKIGAGLAPDKLDEFTKIDDPRAAREWLEINIPGYQMEVVRVVEDFKSELRAERAAILATN